MDQYIKHTWADDEVITADKLNNIETGIVEAKKAAAQTDIPAHNTSTTAHADIRASLQELSNWVRDLLDSDDETLNEMHEVVAYIKSNKDLIDAITISKVNVADIVNNLVTNVANKPLSAAQGVVLKGLIDTLQTAVNGKATTAEVQAAQTAANNAATAAANAQTAANSKAPAYTYGTTDIEAGSASTEPNGTLHFVYE